MSITGVRGLDYGLVLSEKPSKQYSIIFDGCSLDGNTSSCKIPVKNRREVELFLLSLGQEADVVMDDKARSLYPDVWNWLHGRTYSDVFSELDWSYREEDEVIDIIGRIPLPISLNNSFIKIRIDDPDPERINQGYVHKKNQNNVLISKPYQCGKLFYFNGFNESSEFNIDHSSDHLEGIFIFEIARQAGIASAHLVGIPFSAPIIILKSTIRYKKYVECREPYIVRTIPIVRPRGGCSIVVYDVIQKGHSCVTGYLTGIIYKTKETYQRFRHMHIAEPMNEKANTIVDLPYVASSEISSEAITE
ncbi:MAG: AfsA-related hotdog domain-containing protein [Bacillota bacterium]